MASRAQKILYLPEAVPYCYISRLCHNCKIPIPTNTSILVTPSRGGRKAKVYDIGCAKRVGQDIGNARIVTIRPKNSSLKSIEKVRSQG